MRRQLLASLAIGWGILGFGGAAQAETLSEALVSTYSDNPQLQSERANLRATDENVPQALSGWRPQVLFTGSAGYETQNNAPSSLATAGVLDSTPIQSTLVPRVLDLSVTQPVYQAGQTVARTAQAEDLVQSERAHLIAVESAVLFSATQSYFDVLEAQAVVQLDKNNQQVLKRQLDQTNDQFRVGQVTRTDTAQAEARVAAATATLQQDMGAFQVVGANYLRAVGHPPGSLVQPTQFPTLPAQLKDALSMAATKNPNVISAVFAEAAARDNVAATKAQLLPSLNVIGDVNRSDDATTRGRTVDQASVVARVTMPLYEAGNIYSQTRQAMENVGKAQGVTDDQRRAAVQAATSAWQTVQSARASSVSLQTSIKADTIALDGVRQQQLVGTRTVLDILNQQQELFADQTSLIKAEHDLNVAEFNLAQQVGLLSAVDLSLPVKLYDVDAHYKSVRNKWFGFSAKDR